MMPGGYKIYKVQKHSRPNSKIIPSPPPPTPPPLLPQKTTRTTTTSKERLLSLPFYEFSNWSEVKRRNCKCQSSQKQTSSQQQMHATIWRQWRDFEQKKIGNKSQCILSLLRSFFVVFVPCHMHAGMYWLYLNVARNFNFLSEVKSSLDRSNNSLFMISS